MSTLHLLGNILDKTIGDRYVSERDAETIMDGVEQLLDAQRGLPESEYNQLLEGVYDTLDARIKEASRRGLSNVARDVFKERYAEASDGTREFGVREFSSRSLRTSYGVASDFVHAMGQHPDRTTEKYALISRFMVDHPDVKVHARTNIGTMGHGFQIMGDYDAVKAFAEDPRWPKLKEALEDIRYALGPYRGSGHREPRTGRLADRDAYVFGDNS